MTASYDLSSNIFTRPIDAKYNDNSSEDASHENENENDRQLKANNDYNRNRLIQFKMSDDDVRLSTMSLPELGNKIKLSEIVRCDKIKNMKKMMRNIYNLILHEKIRLFKTIVKEFLRTQVKIDNILYNKNNTIGGLCHLSRRSRINNSINYQDFQLKNKPTKNPSLHVENRFTQAYPSNLIDSSLSTFDSSKDAF